MRRRHAEPPHSRAAAFRHRTTPAFPDGGRGRTLLLAGAAIAGGLALLEATLRRAVPHGAPYATVRRSVVITGAAAAADPCAILSDPARLNGLLEGAAVEELAPGRWRWTFAGPGGIPIRVETAIVDDRPGRRVAWRADNRSIMPHEDAYDVVPVPAPGANETVVRGTVLLYPSPVLPLALTGRALRTQADRQLASLLDRLRAALEEQAAAGAAAAPVAPAGGKSSAAG
ncbi:MAG: SRPBCC family protein [Chloroflexota bacterium]